MQFLFNRNKDLIIEIREHFGSGSAEVREIGDGILAVRIEENYDIIFDTGRWKLTMEVKEVYKRTIYPLHFSNTGILPGRLFKGGVVSIERVMVIVKEKLTPLSDHYLLAEEKLKMIRKRERKSEGKSDDFFGGIPDGFDFSEFFKDGGPLGNGGFFKK
jgi:hypothetical protein